jgi:DNA-binding transcriptional LysR family regulator
VTPTAYATHLHEYISQGLESILGALDLTGSYDKQRTITIGTPLRGRVVMPVIWQAVKERSAAPAAQCPIDDADIQLAQFQTDLIIDSNIPQPAPGANRASAMIAWCWFAAQGTPACARPSMKNLPL